VESERKKVADIPKYYAMNLDGANGANASRVLNMSLGGGE